MKFIVLYQHCELCGLLACGVESASEFAGVMEIDILPHSDYLARFPVTQQVIHVLCVEVVLARAVLRVQRVVDRLGEEINRGGLVLA